MVLSDWIGSIGVFLILVAYFLNVKAVISTTHLAFILLNLVGAGLACLASVIISYVPFIILEAVWAFISLLALINYFLKKKAG